MAYWTAHPEAEGTIEAIVEWWLLEQQIREAAFDVEAALDELLQSGMVVRCRHLDGRTFYRLNQKPNPRA